MGKLVALDFVQIGFQEFQPGDILPADNLALTALLLKNGVAVFRGDDYTPSVWTKAKRVSAESGLTGLAIGGELSETELVGKVPLTPGRRTP